MGSFDLVVLILFISDTRTPHNTKSLSCLTLHTSNAKDALRPKRPRGRQQALCRRLWQEGAKNCVGKLDVDLTCLLCTHHSGKSAAPSWKARGDRCVHGRTSVRNLLRSRTPDLTPFIFRSDTSAITGLHEGDAHHIRNAGGRASDAVRSLVISQELLGTREIIIIHHS